MKYCMWSACHSGVLGLLKTEHSPIHPLEVRYLHILHGNAYDAKPQS